MKQHSKDYKSDVRIEQVENGFVVTTNYGFGTNRFCFHTFDEVVKHIAAYMGLLQVGETINIVSEK